MKRIYILFLLSLITVFSACSSKNHSDIKKQFSMDDSKESKEIRICPAPTAFQDVARIMKSPGYWISKIQNPDKIILSKKEIEALNAKTTGRSIYINDIQYFRSRYYRRNAAKQHKRMVNIFSRYYDGFSKNTIGVQYFADMEKNIDYTQFDSTVTVKFAMTVSYSELRALPSFEPLFSSLDTLDLDRMQVTQLDLASPLAILYSTKDGEWYYVVSEIAEGWIHKDSIAFCSQNVIKDYKKWDRLAVTISPNSDIFKNADMTDFFDYVKMGTALPIANINGEIAEIRIPYAKKDQNLGFMKAYISISDISIGYMKYTQRNVINQAFKHMNSPYGWGGMNGEQDCSSFIRQIFACFGITLPRNSTGQIQNGTFAASFEKNEPEHLRAQRIIKTGVPGISLIYFPGHIMLYVGSENNKPYIIHSIWGYGDDTDESESKTYLINRVAITTMSVGEDSKKGSLLQRTTLMKTMK